MNTYHTTIKICYALGLQNQLVDVSIRKQIPYSTAHYWKNNTKPEKYIGSDISASIQKKLSDVQNAHHPINTVPLKLFSTYCNFAVAIVQLLEKKTIQKVLRSKKVEFINLLEKYATTISYQKVTEFLSIKLKTLYHWRTQVKFKCDHSALFLCAKRHPNQATILEVNTMKEWLSKQEYSHWGIHSIWAMAFKQGETNLSKHAWYHYNKLLKIRLRVKKGKKPLKNPIRATAVNEIWHADITVFKTLDGVKHYIYTVMDNYSRFVHAWQIDTKVSAEIRLKTIKDAIQNAFGEAPFDKLQLVTDGGPENDNLTIKAFIQDSAINHTIALKDIEQSNSMMEAFYHTAKYRYLYLQIIHNTQELYRKFEEMMYEYHFLKPHYALGIYTPEEVKNGADMKLSHRNTYAEAGRKRREMNRNMNCNQECK